MGTVEPRCRGQRQEIISRSSSCSLQPLKWTQIRRTRMVGLRGFGLSVNGPVDVKKWFLRPFADDLADSIVKMC